MKILSFISVLLSIAFLINVVIVAGDDDDSETTTTAKDNITAADNNTGFTSSDNAIEKDETASEAEGNEEIETSSLSRGFGDQIKWVKWDDSAELAKKSSKPILLIIHKGWCKACKNLKGVLSESKKFQDLSEYFVMVNTEDDEEPVGDVYSPDGHYVPRLLFIDSSSTVKDEIFNLNGNPKYKYFYFTEDQVLNSMENALRALTNYKASINETENSDDKSGEDTRDSDDLKSTSSDNEKQSHQSDEL